MQTSDSCFMFLLLVQMSYSVSGRTNKVGIGCWTAFVYVALVPRSYTGLEPPSS